MGNKNTSGPIEPTLSNYSPHGSEETQQHQGESSYFRPMVSSHHQQRMSPPFPKRSYTVVEKQPDPYVPVVPPPLIRATSVTGGVVRPATVSAISKSESPSFDEVSDHVTETTPRNGAEDVSLGSSIVVLFDKEVKTVNINKLFEVTCEAYDPSLSPIKGRVSYEARQMRAEFTPLKTLYPNSKITIRLQGKALTTSHCSQSANIRDMVFSFHTCNPSPKTVGIRLKDKTTAEQLQIANFYDLFNSLVNWSSRKWGCSGEHVVGIYSERDDGKLTPLRTDLDILNMREEETIVIEIKD